MRVLVVAGEASGDAHAAKVVRHLVARGDRVLAVGGEQLTAAGATLVAHIDALSVLGFVEVWARLPRLLALYRKLQALLRGGELDLFLPVDFPGLNLRLAATARRAGVPVLYYVGPQVWAWGAGRLQRLQQCVDHVALILPFEPALYARSGVPASFVGHPLLDDPEERERGTEVDLGLFPGSRPQEVRRHLPVLLDAALLLRRKHPSLRLLVSRAPTAPAAWMGAELQARGFDAATVLESAPAARLMRRARALFVASGTATLEAALAERPFAVLYRTGWVNYALARRLVRVPHIALANLVAGEGVVREFIQQEASPAALAVEMERLLFDVAARQQQLAGLSQVRARLGTAGASARVAELAARLGSRHAAAVVS